MQRFVNVATLSQPLAFHICMFDSFASCQIDYVQLGLFALYHIIFGRLRLNQYCENCMRTRTFSVHKSGGHSSRFFAFDQEVDATFVAIDFLFDEPLYKYSFFGIFPDLMNSLVRR